MLTQAVIDDSGSKGQGDTFVLAGFIGRADDWASFADRWRSALERPPAISRFKFWEFAHGEGAFSRLSELARNKKVSDAFGPGAIACRRSRHRRRQTAPLGVPAIVAEVKTTTIEASAGPDGCPGSSSQEARRGARPRR